MTLKLVRGMLLFCMAMLAAATTNATMITFTGDGELFNWSDYSETAIGTTTVSFSYDPGDMSVFQTYSFGAGSTGTYWILSTPVPVSVIDESGTNYVVQELGGFSMFDQPTSFDQVNFLDEIGNLIAQWNDFSSAAFGPIGTDFFAEEANFLDALANLPSLMLSNGGLHINPVNDDHNLTLLIRNASVAVSNVSRIVPEPYTAWLLLLALTAVGRNGIGRLLQLLTCGKWQPEPGGGRGHHRQGQRGR